MRPTCHSFREALDLPRGPTPPHAAECAECAAYVERVARLAEALGRIERRPAPVELEGAVVAALGEGARQDRATRALKSLGRLVAPLRVEQALDGAVDDAAATPMPCIELAAARLRAPAELERRVAEELADPAAARIRRHVAGLPRLSAPEELRERLARHSAPRTERDRTRAWRRVAGALAAGVAFLLLWLEGPHRAPHERGHRLRLERASAGDLEALDAYAQGLIGGLSGGLGSLGREEAR
jgi:hypothetical protein